ncbi:MAG: 4-(cytidine 5'-diphospho)-2-C-methyl-D-erythritol kinase [Zetaproteobacteria bacterium]|nr:MAG: 4-(cytidine 5'-diphospho)-2-C-methyl-D-erythritol kinase [Zetaproteobacteria bacterium]
MTKDIPRTLTIFAPAKINLFLHITGRLSNGYHTLDSLVTFADIGDIITIEPASSFSFHIKGPFADTFKNEERSAFLNGENIVIKAARSLSQIADRPLNTHITLTKNLPLSSGLGGGSSDAAATIWGLQKLWNLKHDADYIIPLMTKLGADVPVCLNCYPTIMQGIGDILRPAPTMPEIPILLINPMISCSTKDIFLHHNKQYKTNITLPKAFPTIASVENILNALDNDLFKPALELIPEIGNVMNALTAQKHCLFSRMSGSGASCFGLFETIEHAESAAETIKRENPDWWIKSGWLNRPERY